MFAPRLAGLLGDLAVAGLTVDVAAVPNDFFGRKIAVAGLLTGQDIQRELARRPLGGRVLIPGVTLREQDGVFLDDLTPADLARDLDVPVQVVEPTPGALLRALVAE
jgi:NifB/MoaA-like Fe-S oxidoreductase